MLLLVTGLIRQQWLVAFVLVIGGIVLLTNSSAWAAPVLAPFNQTVPIPTATPTPTPVPTVTPAPTSTPEPDATEEPTEDPQEGEALDEDTGDFFGNDEDGSTDDPEADEGTSDEPADESDNTTGDGDSGGNSDASGDGSADSDTVTSESSDNNVSDTTSAGPTAVESTGLTTKVAVIVLNVREEPSLESPVLGTVFQDDELEVLGRNGDWWLVCCAFGSEQPAWVNPDFLEPDFDFAQAEELLPAIGQEPDSAGAASDGSVQAVDSSPDLELKMSLNPRYVWQDLVFDLEFVVRNSGDKVVTDVVLRDELLTELEFITASLSPNGEVVKETLDNGHSLVSVRWDSIGAGQEERVSFSLRVVGELEDGYVIDNLSVVDAAETSSTTAGISIGLPPASLPIFK